MKAARSALFRSSLKGVLLSRSARTICWLWATMRVFMVVGRPAAETSPDGSILCFSRRSRTCAAAA